MMAIPSSSTAMMNVSRNCPSGISGFVPTGSMPEWLQGFAQYQPFTPFIESVRGLLLGTPLDSNLWLAIGWAIVITIAGYVWSMAIYERKSVR